MSVSHGPGKFLESSEHVKRKMFGHFLKNISAIVAGDLSLRSFADVFFLLKSNRISWTPGPFVLSIQRETIVVGRVEGICWWRKGCKGHGGAEGRLVRGWPLLFWVQGGRVGVCGAVVLCRSGSVFFFFSPDDEAEAAPLCIYSAVGGSGSRAGVAYCRGRVDDEQAGALPLSRSDGTLVRSSCPHGNTGSEGAAEGESHGTCWSQSGQHAGFSHVDVTTSVFVIVCCFVWCLNAVAGKNAFQSKVPKLWQLPEH